MGASQITRGIRRAQGRRRCSGSDDHMEQKADKLARLLARWLMTELRECSLAVPVPPCRADLWGKPDVIGLRFVSNPADATAETVAVRIARSSADLPAAFGQACSFKLCCHRVYLAIQKEFGSTEVVRCTAVCTRFRIGLIAVCGAGGDVPMIGLAARAAADEPDPVWANPWVAVLSGETNKAEIRATKTGPLGCSIERERNRMRLLDAFRERCL